MRSRSRNHEDESLLVLRGPLLIAVVVLSVLIPIAQSLSLATVVKLGSFLLGLALCSYDLARIGNNRLKVFKLYLRDRLKRVVFDDVMYKFFHPDVSWYKIFTETVLGKAICIYMLPSTSSQRTRLWQASLEIQEDQARNILFVPGGYQRNLLPKQFLGWLDNDDETEKRNNQENPTWKDRKGKYLPTFVEKPVDTTVSSCPSVGSAVASEKETITTSTKVKSESAIRTEPVNGHANPANASSSSPLCISNKNCDRSPQSQSAEQRESDPSVDERPSTADTVRQIVGSAVVDHMRLILQHCPDASQLTAMGLMSVLLLAFHLRVSPRARGIALGILETTSVVGMSAITFGASSLALLKVNENNLHCYISRVLHWRKKMLSLSEASSGGNTHDSRRWSAF